jgi:hypothetical protein
VPAFHKPIQAKHHPRIKEAWSPPSSITYRLLDYCVRGGSCIWSLYLCLHPQTSTSKVLLRLIANASRCLLVALTLRELRAPRLHSVLFTSMLGPARDDRIGGPRHWQSHGHFQALIMFSSTQPYRRAPYLEGFLHTISSSAPCSAPAPVFPSAYRAARCCPASYFALAYACVLDALRLLPCDELNLSPTLGFACAPRMATPTT